jgi:lipopolysaccharide/colanic/teichoic acid biosynthesis glycosyltransferase
MKRLFDITLALIGLVLCLPIMAVAVVLVLVDSPGPAFYGGIRVGRNGRLFRQWKFRTMVVGADSGSSRTADNDSRVTRIGHALRKWKIDELPQLVNVILGQMSLVGPRPDIPAYVDRYSAEQRDKILRLRPGITDWSTLWDSDEGAFLARFEDPDRAYDEYIHPTKIMLQMDYAENHHFFLDCQIILLTIFRLVNRRYVPKPLAARLERREI